MKKIIYLSPIVILAAAIVIQPYFSEFTLEECGTPKERLGDINRGYQRVSTWTEMSRLVDESATNWRAQFSDPHKAWCESKVFRLRQNVRLKVWTMSEVDRNTEHYLFARQFVSEHKSWAVRVGFYVSSLISIPVYSFVKFVRLDKGSPPTWAESYQALRGAWHGLWDAQLE